MRYDPAPGRWVCSGAPIAAAIAPSAAPGGSARSTAPAETSLALRPSPRRRAQYGQYLSSSTALKVSWQLSVILTMERVVIAGDVLTQEAMFCSWRSTKQRLIASLIRRTLPCSRLPLLLRNAQARFIPLASTTSPSSRACSATLSRCSKSRDQRACGCGRTGRSEIGSGGSTFVSCLTEGEEVRAEGHGLPARMISTTSSGLSQTDRRPHRDLRDARRRSGALLSRPRSCRARRQRTTQGAVCEAAGRELPASGTARPSWTRADAQPRRAEGYTPRIGEWASFKNRGT